jgi:conjugal transfer pilus assembly protein TraV
MKWHKNKLSFITFCMMFLLLTGCSSLNAQFDCPMRPGVHCESLDQVNSRVDRGEIGQEKWIKGSTSSWMTSASSSFRRHETVLPIWIAPFEDTDGNYHQASEVYTILKPGYWQGHPPKMITSDEV